MISNKISYIFGLIEIFLFGGAVYGWSFLQYIFEAENVFWEQLCQNRTNCSDVLNFVKERLLKTDSKTVKLASLINLGTCRYALGCFSF